MKNNMENYEKQEHEKLHEEKYGKQNEKNNFTQNLLDFISYF
jgi:hypothetical protein